MPQVSEPTRGAPVRARRGALRMLTALALSALLACHGNENTLEGSLGEVLDLGFTAVEVSVTNWAIIVSYVRPRLNARDTVFRLVVLISIAIGAIAALAAVWGIADVAMALMAIVNLVAISLLGKWAFGAFTDYQRQETAGQDPIFVADGNTDLPSELPGDVWNAENGRTFAAQAGG